MPLNLDISSFRHGTELIKRGFASMQKGGVIMDVTNAEQAAIAEEAGAVAVMALERVPADIRAAGGVARMADPLKVLEIIDAVTIPVMAKCRIGHVAEALVLQSLGVDMIDESEVLTPADPFHHVDKKSFTVPFVCGARDLGEALRRISEGAAMIRTKGEPGTGNIVEAVRHQKLVLGKIRSQKGMSEEELLTVSREMDAPFELVSETARLQRLPVVNFAAGGVASPADAALMMLLGSDGIFVGSGIFKAKNPARMAKAVVEATLHFDDPSVVAEVSKGLGESMHGVEISTLAQEQRMQERGY